MNFIRIDFYEYGKYGKCIPIRFVTIHALLPQ